MRRAAALPPLALLICSAPACRRPPAAASSPAAAPASSAVAASPAAAPASSAAPSAPGDSPRLAICVPNWSRGGAPRLKSVGEAMTIGPALARQRVEALLSDPDGAFPAGTRLLALYELRGGLWVADLSGEVRNLRGGAGERAAVTALVETLALDRKDFTGLRILIDGQPADALGHLDLTGAFSATPGACAER